MIRYEGFGGVTFVCDGEDCGATLQTCTDWFEAAQAEFAEKGWATGLKLREQPATRFHLCPACGAAANGASTTDAA
ncbi:MAG: hypothetical protein NW215_10515 [Hyphomicrobiales bacterium]|nr:hypothetical protein [Hyphomicrobiales bacterium]